MSTNATNAQVAALLRTLNVTPTQGNIIQFQTVLGNVSGCAANIGFAYQIDESVKPDIAELSGSTTITGTYDISISITDYKGIQYTEITSFTDYFSFDSTGLNFNGTGVYDVNISITNQADKDCGPYCSIQTAVPPSVRQDILALTTNCI